MRVCGVICEYNPFHGGHALHLERARALSGADYCLSGDDDSAGASPGMISGPAQKWRS